MRRHRASCIVPVAAARCAKPIWAEFKALLAATANCRRDWPNHAGDSRR
jgi:hypothetical protein